MAESLTQELSFGRFKVGIGTDGSQTRRLIWITDFANYPLALKFTTTQYYSNDVNYSALSSYSGYTHTRAGVKGEINPSITTLTLGSEFIVNGDGTSTTGWDVGNSVVHSIVGGRHRLTNGAANPGYVYQTFTTVIGKTYRIKHSNFDGTISSEEVCVGNYVTDNSLYGGAGPMVNREAIFVATATTTYVALALRSAVNGVYAEFDDISLQEVISAPISYFGTNKPAVIPGIGYWARQSLTNLLLRSQEFDNAAWLISDGTGVIIAANFAAAPDGITTADKFTTNGSSFPTVFQYPTIPTTEHSYSVFLKRIDSDWVQLNYNDVNKVWFNLATGVVGTQTSATGIIQALSNNWYRCTIVFTPAIANQYVRIGIVNADNSSTTPGNGFSILAWQAQVMAGNIPDGGPIITTTAATVMIGADDLQVNDAPASADQLFWATVDYATLNGSQSPAFWSDVAGNNGVHLQMQTNLPVMNIWSGGVLLINQTGPVTTAGLITLLAQRVGGNWRGGIVRAGVLTWNGAAVAAAFPSGAIPKAFVGESNASAAQANNPVKGLFRKLGTFSTDAEVLAAVAETL